MKKFKQRTYTIQEGHYTGPKDLPNVPGALEVIGKTTIGGATIGGTLGGVLNETGIVKDTGILDGAALGGKTGFLAGLAAKFLLDALHKPMKKVEYQEVDKLLRAKFGVYRASGFVVGDTKERRKSIDEKFGFNSRDVESYKISFVIQDNQVTMYTLSVSDEILEKLNLSLDYYCKKFSGMGYTSKPINTKMNSYSVTITFTNYKAISDFIFEISEETGLKINLLTSGALLEKEKSYSMFLDRYDIIRVISKAAGKALSVSLSGPRKFWSSLLIEMVSEGVKKLRDQELAKYFPSARKNFGSSYLTDRLKALGGIEGMTYLVGEKTADTNIRLDRGVFMVTTGKDEKFLSSILPESSKKEAKGKIFLWTIPIQDRREFDIILEKILRSGIKPNVYI